MNFIGDKSGGQADGFVIGLFDVGYMNILVVLMASICAML